MQETTRARQGRHKFGYTDTAGLVEKFKQVGTGTNSTGPGFCPADPLRRFAA
jgi:hypothetical protein